MSKDQRGRVLIVDDEEGLRFILGEYLCDMGFTVDTACSGHEAADKLVKNKYDVLLTDIIMPNGDGEELIRAISASNRFCGLRMVAMSGNILGDLLGARTMAIDGLVDGYLAKPFSYQDLARLFDTFAKGTP